MGLEKVFVLINWGDLKVSPERLSGVAENADFLSKLPPLQIDSGFRNKKIDYQNGHREIKIERTWRNVRLTKRGQAERGYAGFASASTSEPTDSLRYVIYDKGDVENWEHIPGETVIGSAQYTEQEVSALRYQAELTTR